MSPGVNANSSKGATTTGTPPTVSGIRPASASSGSLVKRGVGDGDGVGLGVGSGVARIAGVNLPNDKRLEVGLTYIYGIGRSTAKKIAADTGLSPDEKIKDLTDEEITKLREYIASGSPRCRTVPPVRARHGTHGSTQRLASSSVRRRAGLWPRQTAQTADGHNRPNPH